MAAGFGLASPDAGSTAQGQGAGETVQGQVMQEVRPEELMLTPWSVWLGALGLLCCVLLGAVKQWFAGRQPTSNDFFLQDAP